MSSHRSEKIPAGISKNTKAGLCENIEDDELSAFNHGSNTDKCLEIEKTENIRLTVEQARDIIKLYSGCRNVAGFQALPKAEQEKNIEIFKEKGLSIRQVSRLTGVSFGLVRKHY